MDTQKTDPGLVLVVDDASIVRVSSERVLSRCGYRVQTAESGEAALEAMAKNAADVILLDIRMPGISGLEVLRRAKQSWAHTEVVIMTAYAEREVAQEAMNLGAIEILIKPVYDIRLLMQAVAKAMMRAKLSQKGQNLDDLTFEQLVLSQELCSSPNIQKAKAYARSQKISLREAAIQLGIVTEDDLDWTIARFLKIPYIRIQANVLNSDLIRSFPAAIARKYICLPVSKEDGFLHLVMADPLDPSIISVIEKAVGDKIKPAKGLESEIQALIDKLYGSKFSVLSLEEITARLAQGNGQERDKALAEIVDRCQINRVRSANISRIDDQAYEFILEAILAEKK